MLFQIAMKINWREMCFSITKGNSPFRDKENHSKANVRRRKHRTWKTRGLVENTGSTGKHRAWKHRLSWETRGVENTGSGGKHMAWKTRGLVENTGTQWKGKHGVKVKKKTRGNHYFVEQNQNFVILNCTENRLT